MLEAIKELRNRTHLGMTVCKKALDSTGGDVEQAVLFLQKQGTLKNSEALIEAKEGLVKSKIHNDGSGTIVEVICQTDFAAKTEQFQNLTDKVLSDLSTDEDLKLVSQQLGEACAVKRKIKFGVGQNEIVRNYNHYNGKVSIMLLALAPNSPEVLEFLDNCCLQIVANKPLALSVQEVEKELVTQREIFQAQVPEKAMKMADKIIQGKIDKWLTDVCLTNQPYLLNDKVTVNQMQQELSSKYGEIKLLKFIRFELGEVS